MRAPRRRRIRVRRARLEDAGSLAELSRQLGYPAAPAAIRRRLQALATSPEHAVYVAELQGAVAGWVHVFIHRVLESDWRAEIGGLVVAERFRGGGVGRRLLERAERWARGRRLKAVYLRSNVIRKDAHAFYQKRGYQIIKTQYAFVKNLWRASRRSQDQHAVAVAVEPVALLNGVTVSAQDEIPSREGAHQNQQG